MAAATGAAADAAGEAAAGAAATSSHRRCSGCRIPITWAPAQVLGVWPVRHDLMKKLVKYRNHDDMDVRTKTKQLLGAWKAIYKESNHQAASADQYLREQ
jgi:hypothetical protein